MTTTAPNEPLRDAYGLLASLRACQPGYVPEWPLPAAGAGAALIGVAVRNLQTILQRLERAPDKARLAFYDLLGIQLIPAREALAVVVFKMADGARDAELAIGTRIAASGGPTGQIVFETEHAAGLTSAKLMQAASFWPGRDQWIDHSATLAASKPIVPFLSSDLQNVPHALYLAHSTLLALMGHTVIQISIELTTPGNPELQIDWQYWDGAAWRNFLSVNAACQQTGSTPDGTIGLTDSGRIILTADCGEGNTVAVNGITSSWIRGLLRDPLVPDPASVLPEVNSITLSTLISRPLTFRGRLSRSATSGDGANLIVTVLTEAGAPLDGITVVTQYAGDPMASGSSQATGADGSASIPVTRGPKPAPVTVSVDKVEGQVVVEIPPRGNPIDQVTFNAIGIRADKAFAGTQDVDLTQTFYPFGLAPQAGAAFYFKCDEIFSKPGAVVQMLVAKANTPQDIPLPTPPAANGAAPGDVATATPIRRIEIPQPLPHVVVWEYWNSRDWVSLPIASVTGSSAGDLDATEILTASVPTDIASTKVNDVDGLWLCARLQSGGFGLYGIFTPAQTGGIAIPFVLPRAPALADFRLGYIWQHGPLPPEHTLCFNDFQYEDETAAILWPGSPFRPFQTTKEITPALYLGFDKPLAPDADVGIDFEIEEVSGDTRGPDLTWEYWDGFTWDALSVVDGTNALRTPGIVSFIGPIDSQPLARFGVPLHWLRVRLKEDEPPGAPIIDQIFLNAVPVRQRETIVNEPMGASTGLANQVFNFRQVPVLGDDYIEVRESFGVRANVEWRLLAQDLGAQDLVDGLNALLAAEGTQLEVTLGDVRLVRNRTKQVTEVWVHWQRQPHFFFSTPNDRHYVVDAARGKLQFGDNVHGKVPPAGAALQARTYRTGGGLAGNVAAGAINQLQGAVGGLESASNPRPAGGGADGETIDMLLSRGPRTLRRRGRGVTTGDYETLAREASPNVAVAHALATTDGDGMQTPGWITLVIIPTSDDPQPQPTYALRDEVLEYLATRVPAGTISAGQVLVVGPEYQAIGVDATIVPVDATEAGAVADAARAALETFLHPLKGGIDRAGWPPGHAINLSDVALALQRVQGVDQVLDLTLVIDGMPQGDTAAVRDGFIVAAGELRLKLVAGNDNQ